VLLYSAILWAIIIAAGVSLWQRVPLKVDVIRDRAAIAREVGDDEIENVYRLQIMNTTEQPRVYEIRVSGLHDIHVAGQRRVEVDGATARMVPMNVRVHVEREHLRPGTYPVEFRVRAVGFPRETVREKSVFIVR